MNRYTYINKLENKQVFVCEAEDIELADEMYLFSTGKQVEKQMYVGCCIEFGINKEQE